MIKDLLSARGIDMRKTPPVMYPEAISSLVAKETKSLRTALETIACDRGGTAAAEVATEALGREPDPDA